MQERTLNPKFWDNAKKAEAQLKEIQLLKIWTEAFVIVNNSCNDLTTIYEFYKDCEVTEAELL